MKPETSKKLQDRNGQGLLEIIVAIGVLTTGAFSAMTLMTTSLNSVKEIEARLLGGALGREGIEAVRQIRDSNWLKAERFDKDLEGPGLDYTGIAYFDSGSGKWSINFTPSAIEDDEAEMFRTEDGLVLQFPSGAGVPLIEQAGYRRLVTLKAICDDGTIKDSGEACAAKKVGIEAASVVTWSVGPRAHQAAFIEKIYDWR